MSSPIKFRHLAPSAIQVPEVRVTSIWTDEEYQEFQSTIETNGIGVPLKCIKEGETYWLIDGLHRLDEAKRLGIKKVPVAYTEGALIDAMLKNLYLNRMRGRTPASDEIKLIKYLMDNHGMTVADIAKKTGMNYKRIDQRLQMGTASPYVLTALEIEKIGVGVAYQLSRIPDKDAQTMVLTQILQRITPYREDDVRDIVDDILEYVAEKEQSQDPYQPVIAVRTLACYLCGEQFEAKDMIGLNVCAPCYGIAKDFIQRRKEDQRERITARQALARRAIETPLSEEEKRDLEAKLR